MSVEALAIVLHHSRAKGTDKLILIGIANHDGDGGAYPGIDKLARYAHVDERSVRRSLRRLEAMGEVLTHLQAGGASGVPVWKRPNRYEVLVDCPPTCDRTRHHRERKVLTAPADLWITGGTPTSGGDAHVRGPEDAHVLPPGDAHVPLTIPENHPHEEGLSPEVTTDRANERCSVCFRLEHDCRRAVATSGHEFTPRQSLRSVR